MPTTVLTSKELQKQKRDELAKTNIVVGYDKLSYTTAATEMNALSTRSKSMTPEELERIRSIKEEVRARHFDLGDSNEAPLSYETTSKMQDPTGEMEKYTAKLNVEARAVLLRTSATLGYEMPDFVTSSKAATKWNRADMVKSIAMREEMRKLTGSQFK